MLGPCSPAIRLLWILWGLKTATLTTKTSTSSTSRSPSICTTWTISRKKHLPQWLFSHRLLSSLLQTRWFIVERITKKCQRLMGWRMRFSKRGGWYGRDRLVLLRRWKPRILSHKMRHKIRVRGIKIALKHYTADISTTSLIIPTWISSNKIIKMLGKTTRWGIFTSEALLMQPFFTLKQFLMGKTATNLRMAFIQQNLR